MYRTRIVMAALTMSLTVLAIDFTMLTLTFPLTISMMTATTLTICDTWDSSILHFDPRLEF